MTKTDFKTQLKAVTLEEANEAQKPLLEKPMKQMGMVPNMYANMVNSPGMMETYAVGYDHFRKNSGFNAVEQEVVFLTISIANGCDYCASVHSYIAVNISKLPKELTNSLRNQEEIKDPKMRALSNFTKIMLEKRGYPTKSEVADFTGAGYKEKHILEIILAIAVKTISNYSNHIFHTELDKAFAEGKWPD